MYIRIRLGQLYDVILPLEKVNRVLYERVLDYLRNFKEFKYVEYIIDEILDFQFITFCLPIQLEG